MSEYDAAKKEAKSMMPQLVDSDTGMVRLKDLMALHALLERREYKVIQKQQFGPPGGWQVFYAHGRLLVRIKTKGDAQGFRANQPHMSVSLYDGEGLDWQNDQAKFNALGEVEAKAMTTPENFKPVDFQGNPQRFVVILGDLYTGKGPNAWANRTHFRFPDGFSFAGVETI